MTNVKEDIIHIFPLGVRKKMEEISFFGLEEIRVRLGFPIEFIYDHRTLWMEADKSKMDKNALDEMLNYITGYSYYAMTEEMKKGYLTLQGGHRVGLTGRTKFKRTDITEGEQVTSLVDIGGMNIRIAHERTDCAKNIIPFIRSNQLIYNTLIFAAPGIGKTTYLRDVIRLLSRGDDSNSGLKICVIDERSEIGACHMGKPQNDLGPRTDVLDGCPKEIGMEMVLRSMSPQVIAVDELGKEKEFLILQKMGRSGVKILGTMHGGNMKELSEVYGAPLLSCFERFVELKKLSDGARGYVIYDKHKEVIHKSGEETW